MKLKSLLSKSMLGLGLLFSALPIAAQQMDGLINHDPSVIVTPPTSLIRDDGKEVVTGPVIDPYSPALLLPAGCDTLNGSLSPNNGNYGIMFNVKATQLVRLDFLNSFLTGPGSGYIRLYTRLGSCIPYSTTDAGWVLVDSVFMNVPATGLYRIPIHFNHVMHNNEVVGLYLTFSPGSTAGLQYTDGTTLDTLYSSTTALQMREGIGSTALWDACCMPRVFSGYIEHCPVTNTACENITTTFAAGNGNSGNMFNISTNHDIRIEDFSGHVVDSGYFNLYYRYGSYAGHQDSASHWIFLDSNYVVSAGPGVPTTLFTNVNIPLGEGETMAFYITSSGPASVSYTNGTVEGNVYVYDGVVKLYEGLGKSFPFGANNTPRVWNGIMNYCILPGFIGIEENINPEDQISVYPIPTSNELFMDFKGQGDRKIVITDMTGRVCLNLDNQQTDVLRINVQDFANGIYLYSVYNKGQKEGSGKFIKQ